MSTRRHGVWLGVMIACAALFGCAGGEWEKVEIEQGYRVPKQLTITVIAAPTEKERAEALANALVEELHKGGIVGVVVPAAGGAAEMNVTLYRSEFRPRGFAWAMTRDGQVVVVVEVDTATLGIEGTAYGWVKNKSDPSNAAAAVGKLIGKTIATGRVTSDMRSPGAP